MDGMDDFHKALDRDFTDIEYNEARRYPEVTADAHRKMDTHHPTPSVHRHVIQRPETVDDWTRLMGLVDKLTAPNRPLVLLEQRDESACRQPREYH